MYYHYYFSISLLMVSHESDGSVILRSKIQTSDVYERQGKNITIN